MTALTHWTIAAVIGLLIAASVNLDGPDDVQAAQDVADDLAQIVGASK